MSTLMHRPDATGNPADVLSDYWQNHFPYDQMVRFLGARDDDDDDEIHTPLSCQSFALFSADGRVHCRHARFTSVDEWKKAMTPQIARIESGPAVSMVADDNGQDNSAPLVFDFDGDDYADYMASDVVPGRTSPMNEFSLRHMQLSARLLDFFIRLCVQPGAKCTAVFSGRRGIHLWYPTIRRDWFNADETKKLVVAITRLQERAYANDMLAVLQADPNARSFLDDLEEWMKLVFRARTAGSGWMLWRERANPTMIHRYVNTLWTQVHGSGREVVVPRDRILIAALLLAAPRVDAEVTTNYKHLLKLPFSPHPATSRISVPFPLHNPSLSLSDILQPIDSVTTEDIEGYLVYL